VEQRFIIQGWRGPRIILLTPLGRIAALAKNTPTIITNYHHRITTYDVAIQPILDLDPSKWCQVISCSHRH
jgi:hypothetical protein